jgi:Family of unknown function (DUF5760)
MSGDKINLQSFGTLVQGWVSADEAITNCNREALRMRKDRDAYETEILRVLKQTNHEKAVIQITGGKLVVADDKHTQPLTFTSLEEMLHSYFTVAGRRDETKEIIKYVKENRTVEHGLKLKRVAR